MLGGVLDRGSDPRIARNVRQQPGADAAGGARIGFNVPDLDAFHETMCEHDVPCAEEPKAQFGTNLVQYADPDGMVFSVGEARKG